MSVVQKLLSSTKKEPISGHICCCNASLLLAKLEKKHSDFCLNFYAGETSMDERSVRYI